MEKKKDQAEHPINESLLKRGQGMCERLSKIPVSEVRFRIIQAIGTAIIGSIFVGYTYCANEEDNFRYWQDDEQAEPTFGFPAGRASLLSDEEVKLLTERGLNGYEAID